MKRLIPLFIVLTLLLTACIPASQNDHTTLRQPIQFCYCAVDHSYSSETGVLQWETRDLGEESWSIAEILALYFAGPASPTLRSPFPDGLAVEHVSVQEGVMTLTLNDSFSGLAGVDLTMASACLVQTMMEMNEVDEVILKTKSGVLSDLTDAALKQNDFLLKDDVSTNDQTTMKLYFSDLEGRYLVEETRTRSFSSEESVPRYIINQLLEGPENRNSYPVFPEGVSLLSTQISDGVCTVNFGPSFLELAPKTHAKARMAIFAVVNSLTELPQVECVRFLSVGSEIASYGGLDLSQPLYREEIALGHTSASASADVSIYVPCGSSQKLAKVPMIIRRTTGRSIYSDLLSALISFEPANGYANAIPDGTAVVDASVRDGVCVVTLNSSFALCDADPVQAKLAVQSVVATLCELEQVKQVQLQIQDSKMMSVDLSMPLTAASLSILP